MNHSSLELNWNDQYQRDSTPIGRTALFLYRNLFFALFNLDSHGMPQQQNSISQTTQHHGSDHGKTHDHEQAAQSHEGAAAVDSEVSELERSFSLIELSGLNPQGRLQVGTTVLMAILCRHLSRLWEIAPLPQQPSDVNIVLFDTPEHKPRYSRIQVTCETVGARFQVVPVRRRGTMRMFLMSVMRQVVIARRNPAEQYYFFIPARLESTVEPLRILVQRMKLECPNIRIFSTSFTLPEEPLDGEVVTYITYDLAATQRTGCFIVPEECIRSEPLNCILGAVMVKLACCQQREFISKAVAKYRSLGRRTSSQ